MVLKLTEEASSACICNNPHILRLYISIFYLKIASLIKEKEHLTEKGLAKIESIKSGMNTKRIH